MFFSSNALNLTMSWISFDWEAAVWVGAIVAVTAVVVIAVAVATPFVAIQAGATLLGTCLTVGTIALGVGTIGGIAAGLYQGGLIDAERLVQIKNIQRISNQLDIHFEQTDDPLRAAEFRCTLVIYDETDLASPIPVVTTKRQQISAANSVEFYDQVDRSLNMWTNKPVSGDKTDQPRRVIVYMKPFPGEVVYERLIKIAEKSPSPRCVVTRVEGTWVSAIIPVEKAAN